MEGPELDRYRHSFDVAANTTVCAAKMAWRQSTLTAKTPDSDEFPLSLLNQAQDLHRSIMVLNHCYEQILDLAEPKRFLIGPFVAELRALLYYPPNPPRGRKVNYDPLLLRLAARLNLPLPVYAKMPDMVWPGPGGMTLTGSAPSIDHIDTNDGYISMDIQDWLELQVVLITETDGTQDTITNRDVILKASVALGSAHYDQCVSKKLLFLRDWQVYSSFSALDYLFTTTELAIDALGRWVIRMLGESGLIECSARTFPQWR